MKQYAVILTILIVAVCSGESAWADVPQVINYQGRLTDAAGDPVDTTVSITFTIYDDSTAGTAKWTETQDSVAVDSGLFSVVLGTVNPIVDSVFGGSGRYLGLRVGGDAELYPRTRLVSAPYSYQSSHSDTAAYAASIADDAVNSAKIQDGSVKFGDIGQNGAALNQVPKWDGAGWAAGDDETGTGGGGWTDDGAVVRLTDSTDVVGIGTASPSEKLVVAGNLLTNDTILAGRSTSKLYTSNADMILENTEGNHKIRLAITANDPSAGFVEVFNTYTDSQLLKVDANGNVGIGTTSPAVKLDVRNGRVYSEGTASGTNRILGYSTSVGTNFGTWINPANPSSRAAVIDGDDFIFFSTDWQDNNHFTILSNMIGVGLGVDANLDPITPAISLAIRNNNTGFDWKGNHTFGVITNGTERVRFASNGKVGIGTTTPAKKLDVVGNIRSSGTISSAILAAGSNTRIFDEGGHTYFDARGAEGSVLFWNSSVNDAADIGGRNIGITGAVTATTYYGDGSNLTGISGTTDNDWTINGNTIYHLNGNVGIGTSSPAQKLHIKNSAGNADIRLEPTNPAVAWNLSASNVSGDFYIARFNGSSYTDRLMISNNGNVGIGTTTPDSGKVDIRNTSGGRAIYASTNAVQNKKAAVFGDALSNGGAGIFGRTASLGAADGSSVGVFGLAEGIGGSFGGAALGVLGRVHSYQNFGNSVPVGVFGEAMSSTGICWAINGDAYSDDPDCVAVRGKLMHSSAQGKAILGEAPSTGYAGYFAGKVRVTGYLEKAGGGFKIDHPLDPKNKYLNHGFVESPDMKNIYDGVTKLDGSGRASVTLPDWFDALNKDFRYQLTAIGAPAPNLYIAEEIAGNQFTIAGGEPGMKVSWMVTGIRDDRWARGNRMPVEEDKPDYERGEYLHPRAWGVTGE